MAKSKRIFQLAKELGVASKVILEKCRAEEIDMNNHMSTVSIGLEMTIREWFSDETEQEEAHTAVEVAEKVDLTKVRKAKARKRVKAEPVTEPVKDDGGDVGVMTEVVSDAGVDVSEKADAVFVDERLTGEVSVNGGDGEVESDAGLIVETIEEVEVGEEAAKVEDESRVSQPVVRKNVPKRPDVVKPIGKLLEKPKAAKLKGPKVVRIEKADDIHVSRGPRSPRGPRKPREAQGSFNTVIDKQPPIQSEFIRSRGPERGRGAGVKVTDRRSDDGGRSPRRKKGAGRGGGGADAENIGRSKFSEQDLREREERLNRAGGFLRQRQREMKRYSDGRAQAASAAVTGGKVEIAEPFTIKKLSAVTGIKGVDIVAFLFNKGIMVTINASIDTETAMEVCLEYDIELVVKEAKTAEEVIEAGLEARVSTDLHRRPPVVAILGHVDHGKTSLLDRIRQADVISTEAGGITQHIGAYRATLVDSNGEEKTVVFLDTPGHEAFTQMRARGANLTDVVVVVVAADDGVMPQTVESISHAKAAGVPIVIALNKIDLPNATDENIQRIYGQLTEQGLNPVEWGGETEVVKCSAETGDGILDLIEVLDYQAELLELQADYAGKVNGQVIEAELSPGRGPVARMLVREGQLVIGDFIVMGRAFGRVRDIKDDRGNRIEVAGPATPIELSGIDMVPDAGDRVYVVDTLRQAEEIAEQRRERDRETMLAARSTVTTLDNVFEHMQDSEKKELRVVIKADMQGSVEVLGKTLAEIGQDNEEVKVTVLHSAVGGITESDVILAEASDAILVGFQVIASPRARNEGERRGVDIRLYRVIYNIVDDITNALEGMLTPERREEVLGHAEVREVFKVSKVGAVAGCYVTDGVVQRSALIRVTRNDIVIEHDRTLETLKRFKDDARDVRSGMECGMSIKGYDDIHEGDILECYVAREIAKKL